MSNNSYKVRIYSDNRFTVYLHSFNPFSVRQGPYPKRSQIKAVFDGSYMPAKDYVKLLKSAHKKFWDRQFPQNKSVFITLTTRDCLPYHRLNNEFRRFLVYVKRSFGKAEYLRAIERHAKADHFHIHAILQFNGLPKTLTSKTVERLWGLGGCKVQKVYDIYGVIQYVTKYKKQNLLKEYSYFSCFPKGAKVISSSQHFGVPYKSNEYRDIKITSEHLAFLLNYHLKASDSENGKFVRLDGHNYFNKSNCEIEYCLDRVFIRTTKDFIQNNF